MDLWTKWYVVGVPYQRTVDLWGCLICIMTSVLRGQIRSIKGQVINHFQVRDDYWRFGLVFLSKRRPWIKYLALIRPLSSPKHLQVPSFVY